MKKMHFLLLIFGCLLFGACNRKIGYEKEEKEKCSDAGIEMDAWSFARSYPDNRIYSGKIYKAFEQKKSESLEKNAPQANWQAIGPKNIGGRTLCIAFHPTDTSILYAGSASGGLWKTNSSGIGSNAWHQIHTGFPVLGVAAIAINPSNPQVMYIGTGEVYDYQNVGTGFTVRTNRGTYGIGILKTTDGGVTWTKSLDWSYSDLRGVQRIAINPLNTNTVFAATTEGLYRTYDAGNHWQQVDTIKMAVDIEITPNDTSKIFVTHGCFDNPISGIFRSVDGGNTFSKLTNGLPNAYTGKALLAISPSSPNTIYASIANDFQTIGLYKSTNGGNNWTQMNTTDVATYQGWYSHDVTVKPDNANTVIYTGIDSYKSTDGGTTFQQKSNWQDWYFGAVQAGESEGPGNYVHADIHAVYYAPGNNNKVVMATDGGVFISWDNAENFNGCNGGYQTQQFHANFSNSTQDSLFAIGGMQDNASAIYQGTDSWFRVIGGDGMCTAINPLNDSMLFASTQNMFIRKSVNRGTSFSFIDANGALQDTSNFNGPFEMSLSNPNILYAGGQRLYRTTNNGLNWANISGTMVDSGNPILNIAVCPQKPDLIYFSTSPNNHPPARLYKSNNAGVNRTIVQGLPDRLAMDIAFHPVDSNTVYVVFSGFNTHHVYKTINGGASWSVSDAGLPDVPTNTIVIDPLHPDFIYVGNDLGVWFSPDAGSHWLIYHQGLPDAVLAMHLSISPANRKLRLATHGNGVYQSQLQESYIPDCIAPDYLSGTIQRNGTGIPLVNITLKNQSGLTIADTISMAGNYALQVPDTTLFGYTAIPDEQYPGADITTLNDSIYPYRIIPSRNDWPLNGVTTFDIVLIQKHILNISLLASPYQLIAADVNNSGSVTALDLVQMRKLILQIDTVFQNVPSWRFIPKTWSFNDPGNPFSPPFPEQYYYHPCSPENSEFFDFEAVKVGDVNASSTFGEGELSEIRNDKSSLLLETSEQELKPGTEIIVKLKAKNMKMLMGFQFALAWDPTVIEYAGIEREGIIQEENIGVQHAKKGVILTSWNSFQDEDVTGKDLIILSFKVLQKSMLSKTLHLNPIIEKPEYYADEISGNNIQLTFGSSNSTMWTQVQPNPIQQLGYLKYVTEKEGITTLEIFNAMGQKVVAESEYQEKGLHSFSIEKNKMGNAGVYFFHLQTADGNVSGSFIIQ